MFKAMKIAGLAAIVTLFATSPLLAANSLQVTEGAALQGTYGLEVTLDGASSGVAFVEDDSPTAETTYRFQFWLDHNTPSMANTEALNIFKGLQDSGDKKNILVKLKKSKTGDSFIIYVFVRNDAGAFVLVGKGMQFKDKAIGVMVEWQASSGADDGFARMYKVTTAGGAVLKGEATGLDNDTKIVDKARMGLTSAPPAGATATMYFDSFESYRTLAP